MLSKGCDNIFHIFVHDAYTQEEGDHSCQEHEEERSPLGGSLRKISKVLQPPDTIQTPPRHLPDTFFSCYHKRYIIIGKVKKFEDIVAIEKFWKSQYENDPGTKCPPPCLIGLKLCCYSDRGKTT